MIWNYRRSYAYNLFFSFLTLITMTCVVDSLLNVLVKLEHEIMLN